MMLRMKKNLMRFDEKNELKVHLKLTLSKYKIFKKR